MTGSNVHADDKPKAVSSASKVWKSRRSSRRQKGGTAFLADAEGRPATLSAALIESMSQLIEQGNPVKTVCDQLGISVDTFYAWLEQGYFDCDDGDRTSLYAQFYRAWAEAVDRWLTALEGRQARAGRKNWRTIARQLESRFPDCWS